MRYGLRDIDLCWLAKDYNLPATEPNHELMWLAIKRGLKDRRRNVSTSEGKHGEHGRPSSPHLEGSCSNRAR